MPRFTTIQLTGLDNTSKVNRPDYTLFYGYREVDAARRVIGIGLKKHDAEDIMSQAAYIGGMPKIEVDDRFWFYVAAIGDAVWEKGKEPESA